MRASVFLADAAQQDQATNKVSALGLGWSQTGSPTPPAAVIVMIKVPWNATNTRHSFSLKLVDDDGRAVQVTLPGQEAPANLELSGSFEVGRPPGLVAGSDIDQNLVVPLGPGLPLPSGRMYEWRLEIDGHHEESWGATFYVRPA